MPRKWRQLISGAVGVSNFGMALVPTTLVQGDAHAVLNRDGRWLSPCLCGDLLWQTWPT